MPCFALPRGLAALALAFAALTTPSSTEIRAEGVEPLKSKHIGISRNRATSNPRSEGDQAIVDGWPLYRTERGQTVFNEAMATLKATDKPAPSAAAFSTCPDLKCQLVLPELTADGWVPPGRIWMSPSSYVLFVKSPRQRDFRRRSVMNMQVFVFHEFHNSSRNTDLYDTISSHSRDVFVPFYMSKQSIDAQGRSFVIVVQVAPADVSSVHASNMGSAGPGIEVAKNASDPLEPLQGHAGILVASIVKEAVPRLKVVNHRGSEGAAMLSLYNQHLTHQRTDRAGQPVTLPFTPAAPQQIANAQGRLDDLILRRGASPRIAAADRSVLSGRNASVANEPKLIEPPRLAARPLPVAADPKPLRPWHRASQRSG
jgi:hypothetical protein